MGFVENKEMMKDTVLLC